MIYKKKGPENDKSYNELKEENQSMKKTIIDLSNIIAELKGQSNNLHQKDTIEEKINILKNTIQNMKEKCNIILYDIISLETVIKDINNQIINFDDFKKAYIDEFKKNFDEKMKLELKNFYEQKVKEKIENMNKQYQSLLEKLNKKDEAEIKKDFSYKCINSEELYAVVNKDDNKAKIKIILKNNGNLAWPENSILGFNRKSRFSGDQIKLNPQKPGEESTYVVTLESLQYAKPGEYQIIFEVYFSDKIIDDEQIIAKIVIKENNN